MKFSIALTFLSVFTAAYAQNCGTRGANCGGPGDRACCGGTFCRNTLAPVGGVGKICQK
ncbi:hypothetical protein HYFRA_00007993 [Hymenoscyphus fraxineus]|uniref:Uncharacterized protein n=1 Tax=Hymenoscyphus fraxineus TaxID=746836 RepID=A0A9N9PPP0_9HELO|nr:hypothetical protein HYFRA_00007993 [Hymenoscyphus fraxineus]